MFNLSLLGKNALVILRTKHWIIHQNHSYNFSSQNSMYHFIFPTMFSLDILWQDLKLRWMGFNQTIKHVATPIVCYLPEMVYILRGQQWNSNKHTWVWEAIIIPRGKRSYFSFQVFHRHFRICIEVLTCTYAA